MKGGPAVTIFEEEYEKRFGIKPMTGTPDAVQLNRALKAVGDDYRELVAFYLAREDRFLEGNGYSGRLITASVVNAWRLTKARTAQRRPVDTGYRQRLQKWQEENDIATPPILAGLPLAAGSNSPGR